MNKKWFTSDLHHAHKNIVKFTNRGIDTTQEDHDDWLVKIWNSQVHASDIVYHLGDLSFAKDYKSIASFVAKLKGNIKLIKGNHDQSKTLEKLASEFNNVEYLGHYKELSVSFDDNLIQHSICMFHFPIASWHKQGYGSWHLHGHCVDSQTEILTENGWRNKDNISKGEKLLTFNIITKTLEQDEVLSVVYKKHTGKVYSYSGKSVNFRVTDGHVLVGENITSKEFVKFIPENFPSKFKAITSSNSNKAGTGLSNEMLKLYILIAADGSIKEETNLVRIRVKKKHKIDYIRKTLRSLSINCSEYESDSYISFNFYIPNELILWNFKGLDKKLLNATEQECSIIVEAYCNSDGHTQPNGVVIYSAKENEIDLLQQIFAVNNYMTTKYSRNHNFGTNLQHQLSVTKNNRQTLHRDKLKEEYVTSEDFWCITTNNQNFISRRNGRVHLTGNCHGNFLEGKGKMLDVGLDSAYTHFGQHKFFDLDDIRAYMQTKEVHVADSHRNL